MGLWVILFSARFLALESKVKIIFFGNANLRFENEIISPAVFLIFVIVD